MNNSPHTSNSLSASPNPLPVKGEGKYLNNELAWGGLAIACIAFFGFVFGIGAALFTLLGILILWWTFRYPEEGFLTLIAISPLLPLLKATQTMGDITLIKDVIIITLFLKNFLFPLITQRLPYRRNLLFAPLIALSSWAVLEVLNAGVTTLSVLRLRDIVLYMMLYFGVLYLPHTAVRMSKRLLVFLATLIITMALGVFQFIALPDSTVLRFDPAREIWIPRIASTFAHPTVFAEYVITGSVILLGLLLVSRVIPSQVQNPRRTAFFSVLFLSTIILLYFTYTRAAWIGFVAGVVAMAIARISKKNKASISPLPIVGEGQGEGRKASWPALIRAQHKGWANLLPNWGEGNGLIFNVKKYLLPLIFFIIIFLLILRFTSIGTFIKSAFDPNYASNADRIVFMYHLISQTSNTDAVIGKGLGNTITEQRKGGDATAFDIASGESRTIQLSKDSTLVDNQYLKTFIEMGVIGVVLTFWLFYRFFLASVQSLRKKDALSYMLGISCLGFLAAFMVQALFVDIWDVYPTNAIFWTLAALVSTQKETNN